MGYGGVIELAVSSFASISMTPSQLPNYLLSNRKRLAFSQEEVAFLLGAGNGQTVCRHERFVREPSLEMAFAYEAIYKRSASELFGGLYQKVEKNIAARANLLAERIDNGKENPRINLKRQKLSDLAGSRAANPNS